MRADALSRGDVVVDDLDGTRTVSDVILRGDGRARVWFDGGGSFAVYPADRDVELLPDHLRARHNVELPIPAVEASPFHDSLHALFPDPHHGD